MQYKLLCVYCARFPIAPGQVGRLSASFNTTGAAYNSTTRMYALNMNIVWSEPLNPNGIITSYEVTVARTDNSTDVVYSNISLTAPNVTALVSVLAFTNYTVSVVASTSVGEGASDSVIELSPESGKDLSRVHNICCVIHLWFQSCCVCVCVSLFVYVCKCVRLHIIEWFT